MITVEERLKRIEGQLDRIAKALEDISKFYKVVNQQREKEDALRAELALYLNPLEESD